jgi:hypothetical protein
VISLSANVYVIFQKQPSDYFGIWYSTKSGDPKSGTFKELADLTYFASNKFNNWHDSSEILLNNSGTAVYIAFRYKEVANWFTIGVDTVEIKGIHTSGTGHENTFQIGEISIFPNPSVQSFHLKLPASLAAENVAFEINDLTGKQVYREECNRQSDLQIMPRICPGMYTYKVTCDDGRVFTGKLMVD